MNRPVFFDGLRTSGALGNLVSMRKLSVLLAFVLTSAGAQVPALFQGADTRLGEKLIAQNKCAACHQKKVGGDGNAIYRPAGRINNPGALGAMVEQCNTQLNLGMFPEDVIAVAAVLNRDHYHFTK